MEKQVNNSKQYQLAEKVQMQGVKKIECKFQT